MQTYKKSRFTTILLAYTSRPRVSGFQSFKSRSLCLSFVLICYGYSVTSCSPVIVDRDVLSFPLPRRCSSTWGSDPLPLPHTRQSLDWEISSVEEAPIQCAKPKSLHPYVSTSVSGRSNAPVTHRLVSQDRSAQGLHQQYGSHAQELEVPGRQVPCLLQTLVCLPPFPYVYNGDEPFWNIAGASQRPASPTQGLLFLMTGFTE